MSFLFKCAILRFSSQPGLSRIMRFVARVCVCPLEQKLVKRKRLIMIISVTFRQRCQTCAGPSLLKVRMFCFRKRGGFFYRLKDKSTNCENTCKLTNDGTDCSLPRLQQHTPAFYLSCTFMTVCSRTSRSCSDSQFS